MNRSEGLPTSGALSWSGNSEYLVSTYTHNNNIELHKRETKSQIWKLEDNKLISMEGPNTDVNNDPGRRSVMGNGGLLVQSFIHEWVVGLQAPLSFVPNGSLVTGAFCDENYNWRIVFWEKNGLKHGEFNLDKDNICSNIVCGIYWNMNSSVLAIVLGEKDIQNNVNTTIIGGILCLYTTNNYKWYLKQRITGMNDLKYIKWITNEKILIIRSSPPSMRIIRISEIYHSSALQKSNNRNIYIEERGTVGVINGSSVYMTSFAQNTIPPPMWQMELRPGGDTSYIQQMAFDGSSLVFLSHVEQLYIYKICWEGRVVIYDKLGEIEVLGIGHSILLVEIEEGSWVLFGSRDIFDTGNQVLVEVHILYLIEEKALLITKRIETEVTKVICKCIGRRNGTNIQGGEFIDQNHSYFSNQVSTGFILEEDLTLNSSEIYVFLQTEDRSLLCYTLSTSEEALNRDSGDTIVLGTLDNIRPHWFKFPEICSSISSCILTNKEAIIGLATNKLYINDQLFSKQARSFCILDNFLLIVASCQNQIMDRLLIFNLNKNLPFGREAPGDPLQNPLKDQKLKIYNSRNLEKGGRIISFINYKIILQMPRGNLEIIIPRYPLLQHITSLMSKQQYGGAFSLCRQHKIDLNILHDWDKLAFNEQISTFVSQVRKVDYLNIFINQLRGQSTEECEFLLGKSISTGIGGDNSNIGKVNELCERICKELESQVSINPEYILCIINCYMKQTPPKLSQTLDLVQNLKLTTDANIDPNNPKPQNTISARQALKYACWLTKAELMYQTALEKYNFEMAIMIAEFTQKDPKEFLGYINEVKLLDEVHMKFRIQNDLKNYKLALSELVKGVKYSSQNMECSVIQECVQYMNQYKLFEYGQLLFKTIGDKESCAYIDNEYAQWLNAKGQKKLAAKIFLMSESYTDALQLFKEVGDWDMAKSCALALKYSKDQIDELGNEIYEMIKQTHENNVYINIYIYIYIGYWGHFDGHRSGK